MLTCDTHKNKKPPQAEPRAVSLNFLFVLKLLSNSSSVNSSSSSVNSSSVNSSSVSS